jgi:hypothetical protein
MRQPLRKRLMVVTNGTFSQNPPYMLSLLDANWAPSAGEDGTC